MYLFIYCLFITCCKIEGKPFIISASFQLNLHFSGIIKNVFIFINKHLKIISHSSVESLRHQT